MNDVFKALSDPTRRKILELLKERDMTAGEITEQFHMTGASISHHLTILKTADLVISTRRGQNIIYSLNATVFQEMLEWILNLKEEKP